MNKDKWRNTAIPLGVLVAKLAEETGEVANHYADVFFNDQNDLALDAHHRRKMTEEARQVKFIAERIINKLSDKQVFEREWAHGA